MGAVRGADAVLCLILRREARGRASPGEEGRAGSEALSPSSRRSLRQLPGRKGKAGAAGWGGASAVGEAGSGRPASVRAVLPGPAVARQPTPGSRLFSDQERPGGVGADCEEQRVGAGREASLR